GPVRLKLRPSVHFRPHDAPVRALHAHYRLVFEDNRYELHADAPELPLRLFLHGQRTAFTVEARQQHKILYRIEESRGYDSTGDLWSPGYFRVDLTRADEATLVASTEPWDVILALPPADALGAEHERRRRLLQIAPAAAQKGPGE